MNNYFNEYLCHTYKWQRILNHCNIDGITYCRILLLTNTRTCTNATTFSVENRLLGNENSGRGFSLSDADTLPQSNQASFSWVFTLFFDTSFQSARLNFSHWNNTEKNGTFSLFETSVKETVTFAYIMTFHFHSVLETTGLFQNLSLHYIFIYHVYRKVVWHKHATFISDPDKHEVERLLSGPSLSSNSVHWFYFWLVYLHTLKEKQTKTSKNKKQNINKQISKQKQNPH